MLDLTISVLFQGLFQILKEDNVKKQLPYGYRQDLEKMVLKTQKEGYFKIAACNAVRLAIDGNLLQPNFLASLRSIDKAELSVLQDVRLNLEKLPLCIVHLLVSTSAIIEIEYTITQLDTLE